MMDLNPSRQWPWFRACDGLCWIWVEFGAFYETLQCSFVYFGEEQSCWQRLGSMCGGSTVKLLNCARLIFGLFRDNFQDQGWSLCLHTSPPRPHRLVSNCPDQIYVQYVQMIDICKTLRKMQMLPVISKFAKFVKLQFKKHHWIFMCASFKTQVRC